MSGEGAGLVCGPLIEAPLEFRLQPGGRKATKSAFILCPKCETQAFIRRSERVTEKVTQLVAHCTNSACGHTYRLDLVFVHTLVPGNIDRPDLDLPQLDRDQVPHIVPPARAGPDDDQQTMFTAGTG